MDVKNKKPLKKFVEAGVYFSALLLTAILFIFLKPMMTEIRKGVYAQTFIAVSLCACIAVIAYLGMTKRLTVGKVTVLLLIVGYVLRVGYMLYTPVATRQQDTFTKNFDGHEAYAWTIFSTGKLPENNVYQFYHPPLNAMVQAAFMRLSQSWTNAFVPTESLAAFFAQYSYAKPDYVSEERYFLYATCQILAAAYSFYVAVTLVKTVKLFGFSEKWQLALSAFVILYPRQIQFSGQVNNDGLSYLLATLALYYALKWQKQGKSWLHLVLCALSVGLGMMTKLSSATICLPIAGIFIYEFIRTLQKKEGAMSLGACIGKYVTFLAVCAPIGLWFQVYANIRFDQEFGFVFSNLNRKLYTGDHSFFERFFVAFDLKEYFGSIYCRPFEYHYNLFNYALRSSIFGEFSYWQGEGFAVTAVYTAYLAAIFLAISLVWAIVVCVKSRKAEEGVWKKSSLSFPDLLFVFLLVQSQALSEIYFYIKMPYGCTMDFRYIMPMILGIALTLGYTRKVLAVEGGKFSMVMNRLTLLATSAFLLSSTLFYCVCI